MYQEKQYNQGQNQQYNQYNQQNYHNQPLLQQNEEPEYYYEPMSDEDRPGFIRKVYGILSVQLIFTAGFSALCMSQDHNMDFVHFMLSPALFYTVIAVYISSICALVCCELDTKVPINYILLTVFTMAVSWIVGIATMMSKPMVVFEAATLTTAMVVGLTFYAIKTKTDFTMCGGALWLFMMVFLTASLFAVFVGPSMNLGIAVLGVILFGFYLIYDTQMIVGGKHRRYQFDKDRYILAAVSLYLDIINIFLYLLAILNGEKPEE